MLDSLDEPKQILQSLIDAMINGTDVNERIVELGSCLEVAGKATRNSNITTSESDNLIASNNEQFELNIRNED